MKKLFLLRHGRSEAKRDGLADASRCLTAEGRTEIAAMAERLDPSLEFDAVIASPAVRAQETWDTFRRGLGLAASARTDGRLYPATALRSLVELVEALEDEARSVLLIGHNPQFEDFGRQFDPDLELVAGGLVRIDLDVESWRDVAKSQGTLTRLSPE